MEIQEVGNLLEEFIKQKNTNSVIYAWLKLKTLHVISKKQNVPLLDRTRSLLNIRETLKMAENTQNIYRDPKSEQKRLFNPPRDIKYGTYSHLHNFTRSRKKILSNYERPVGFEDLVLDRLGNLQQTITNLREYSSVNENSNQNGDPINSRSVLNCFHFDNEFTDNRYSIGPITLKNKQSCSSLRTSLKKQLESSSAFRPTRMNSQYFQAQTKQHQQTKNRIPKITHEQIQSRIKSNSIKTKTWQPRFQKSDSTNKLDNVLLKIKERKYNDEQQHTNRRKKIQTAISSDKISKKIKQIRQKITMGRHKATTKKPEKIQSLESSTTKFRQISYPEKLYKVGSKQRPFNNLQIKFIKTQEEEGAPEIEYGLQNDSYNVKVNKSILKNSTSRKVLVRKPQSREPLKFNK